MNLCDHCNHWHGMCCRLYNTKVKRSIGQGCVHYWEHSSPTRSSAAVAVDGYNPALRYDKWLVLDAYGTPRAAVSSQDAAERVARPELNDRIVHVREVVDHRPEVKEWLDEEEDYSLDDRVSLTEEGLRMAERIAAEDRSTVRIPPTSPMAKRVGLHLRVESARCVDPAAVRELEDSADVLLGDEHA